MIIAFIVKFILWVLITYGITQILVESMLFENFRMKAAKATPRIGDLLQCMLCTGVWMSFLTSIILWSPTNNAFLVDILNPETVTSLQVKIASYPDGFHKLLTTVIYKAYAGWGYFRIIFFDGMLGGTMIWLIHLFEIKLSK